MEQLSTQSSQNRPVDPEPFPDEPVLSRLESMLYQDPVPEYRTYRQFTQEIAARRRREMVAQDFATFDPEQLTRAVHNILNGPGTPIPLPEPEEEYDGDVPF